MDPDFEARANALVAQSDGAIWIESGDRTTEEQERLYQQAVIDHGEADARNWAALPGESFHEKGKAIDFGGDMKLLARLAPQFGLWQPMSWEQWHWEPIGSRDGSEGPGSLSEKPVNPSTLYRPTKVRDYGSVMAQLFNLRSFNPTNSSADISLQRGGTDPIVSGNPGFLTPELMGILGPLAPGPRITVPGQGVSPSSASKLGGTGLDRFMAALRDVESSGNYQAEGVPTQWGTATGAYQYLDSTWDNYKGYARAKDAPPEIQDEKAAADMQRYYDEYGSWDDVSAAWYSGPGGNWQSGEVQEYVGKVNARL